MLVTYIIGSLALIVKPGPDLTCTIATALSDGKANAATLMFGLIAGCWMWVLLLTAGVASQSWRPESSNLPATRAAPPHNLLNLAV